MKNGSLYSRNNVDDDEIECHKVQGPGNDCLFLTSKQSNSFGGMGLSLCDSTSWDSL